MATPETPEINPADYQCQTPDCPRPFKVVSFMVGDSSANFHCLGCWMAWNAAVITKMAELGMIETGQPDPAIAGT